jgi:hypothetical protein
MSVDLASRTTCSSSCRCSHADGRLRAVDPPHAGEKDHRAREGEEAARRGTVDAGG